MSNLKQTLYEGQWLRLVRIGHWESCERTHAQGMAVLRQGGPFKPWAVVAHLPFGPR